jgi:putative membrane protein
MRGTKLLLAISLAIFAMALIAAGQSTPQPAPSTPASPSTAAKPASPAPSNATNLSAADKKFLTEAAEAGMAQVQLGQLATQKASSDDVKKFAQRMVDEHGKVNEKLAQIAASSSVVLPSQLSAGDQMIKDKLNSLSGAAFDKAYMDIMLKDHDDDVAAFLHEAQIGSSSNVADLAKSTVPVLESHLDNLRSIIKNQNAPPQPSASSGQ